MMKFKLWLEEEQQPKGVRYYLQLTGLPLGLAKMPNAYQLLQESHNKLIAENNPEAQAAYLKLHDYLDKQQGGKHFDTFFTDVTNGKADYVPQAEFRPILDMSQQQDWMKVREKYHGNFDKHIKTSIPTFGELQDKKGHAIATAFKDRELDMLDIGGSEGSFARTISHMTNGQVRTEILDPNDAMADFYHSKGVTPGSTYNKAAFMKGWINDNGTRTPELNSQTTSKRYDIIHEAMAFQFMSNQRDAQVSEVKALLKPGGMFLTEQKLKTNDWDANEDFKNVHHKNLYYSDEALKKKEKVVAFAAEKKPFGQDADEEEAVGMVNNMVHHDEYEKTLTGHFANVWQYWDSGNFKGYAASDGNEMIMKFLGALGDVNSKFSNVHLPRRITGGETNMPSFQEWCKKHRTRDELVGGILPPKAALEKMSFHNIKDRYGDKLIHAARLHDVHLTDDDVADIIHNAAGVHEIEPHIKHYHLHL